MVYAVIGRRCVRPGFIGARILPIRSRLIDRAVRLEQGLDPGSANGWFVSGALQSAMGDRGRTGRSSTLRRRAVLRSGRPGAPARALSGRTPGRDHGGRRRRKLRGASRRGDKAAIAREDASGELAGGPRRMIIAGFQGYRPKTMLDIGAGAFANSSTYFQTSEQILTAVMSGCRRRHSFSSVGSKRPPCCSTMSFRAASSTSSRLDVYFVVAILAATLGHLGDGPRATEAIARYKALSPAAIRGVSSRTATFCKWIFCLSGWPRVRRKMQFKAPRDRRPPLP